MTKDDVIDLGEADEAARQRFLNSIPKEIKQAYSDEFVSDLAKQFEIKDRYLLQKHLFLAAKFYLKAQEPRTKRPPSEIKKEMTAISNKATALLRQLSGLDPITMDYLEQADSLMMRNCIEELTQVTEHPRRLEQPSLSGGEVMAWPTLEDVEAALKHLRALSDFLLDSLQGEKGGKPPNRAMPMWVRSAERLLEVTSGEMPGPKRLFDFCYESLVPLEDEPNQSAIEETIKTIRTSRKDRSSKP